MGSFIDEYLRNPANAVASARECAGRKSWKIDDDLIYKELASPEFRLYEEIIFCMAADDLHLAENAVELNVYDSMIIDVMLEHVESETAAGRVLTSCSDGRVIIR